VLARSDLEDLVPGEMDKGNLIGNHVAIHCDAQGVTVLLAHLQQGSTTVQSGETVGGPAKS